MGAPQAQRVLLRLNQLAAAWHGACLLLAGVALWLAFSEQTPDSARAWQPLLALLVPVSGIWLSRELSRQYQRPLASGTPWSGSAMHRHLFRIGGTLAAWGLMIASLAAAYPQLLHTAVLGVLPVLLVPAWGQAEMLARTATAEPLHTPLAPPPDGSDNDRPEQP